MKKELFLDENLIKYKIEKQVKVGDLLINVPLRYKCNALNVIFSISTEEAKKILKSSKFKPLEIMPGRSLLNITFFQFISGPVGPYTEMSLSIIVSYKHRFYLPIISLVMAKILNRISFFVFSIAQSTKIAIEHGLAITGYPRYNINKLIDVNFQSEGRFISVYVSSEGEKILKLTIKKPKKEKIIKEIHPTYFIKNENISTIQLEDYGIIGKSKVYNMELGNHELSNLLKKLKISQRSIDVRYYRDTTKIVHLPKVLESL